MAFVQIGEFIIEEDDISAIEKENDNLHFSVYLRGSEKIRIPATTSDIGKLYARFQNKAITVDELNGSDKWGIS